MLTKKTSSNGAIEYYNRFLGSGKTTLLKNLLQQSSDKRIAVIQNEFAPSGVDGKELKQVLPGKLLEVNNGSVFCVCMFSNFAVTLKKLIEDYQPDEIFLETSGLADPINVAELLQDERVVDIVQLNLLITVVDAGNYYKGLSSLQRFKHQLMVADLVLINKIDLEPLDLAKIKTHIHGINPNADIQTASYAKVGASWLHSIQKRIDKHFNLKGGDRPDELNACVLRMHNASFRKTVKGFFN